MARCNIQCFVFPRKQRVSPRLLMMVLAALGLFCVTESTAQIQLRGVVGQNVTFHCPYNKHKMIKLFYLQRNNKFVNGFHVSRQISEPIWENTELNKTDVHMYKLNVSNSGDYRCHIQYSDYAMEVETHIHLNVTGNYNTPTVTTTCESRSCKVTCASGGGYPSNKIRWNVEGNTSSQMWRQVNSEEQSDPDTMLVNSSSTAFFNCSQGVPVLLSCSVGNVTSHTFSVCEESQKPGNTLVIVTATVTCALFVIMGVVLRMRCRKERMTGTGESGSTMEVRSLASSREEEAS